MDDEPRGSAALDSGRLEKNYAHGGERTPLSNLASLHVRQLPATVPAVNEARRVQSGNNFVRVSLLHSTTPCWVSQSLSWNQVVWLAVRLRVQWATPSTLVTFP